MENSTEIMEIEKGEIIEPEVVEEEGSGFSLTAFGLGVGAALIGGFVYNKAVKPAIAKWKKRKEQKSEIPEEEDFDDSVDVNPEEEN